MIARVRSILRRENGRIQPVVALALMVALGALVIANAQLAGATIGSAGGHTDVGFTITSSFDAQTSTWTYEVSGAGPHGISHITIGICDDAGELVSTQDWDPDADSRGNDPSTGFPANGSGLTGYKWEDREGFIGTYSFTLPGFSNDPGGAEAVIKAGQDHEHFASLDGPDCGPATPTDTPRVTGTPIIAETPTPTDTPIDTPTDTPAATPTDTPTVTPTGTPPNTPEPSPTGFTPTSEVLATVVGPTSPAPTGDPLGLPTTGAGGPVSSSSIVLYVALASLGAGLLLLGYWRYRVVQS